MPATVLLAATMLLSSACAMAEGSTRNVAETPEPAAASESAEPPGELTVFAAASLSDVLARLEERWLESHPDVSLVTTFDASSTLAVQIAQGAPADVFVSADTARPMDLFEAGHTAARPVLFARDRLTIAVPLGSEPVSEPADLADPGIRLVAAAPGVPITRYGDEAIAQLAADMPDPGAFLERVAANVVTREDNVRAALAKVELGEGDAVIAYVTDARESELVDEVPFPDTVDVTAEYAAVRVSEHVRADDFLVWLRGPEAADILAAAGYEPVPG